MMNGATSNRCFDVLRSALRGEWDSIIRFYTLHQISNIDIEDDNNSNVLVSSLSGDTILHICALCRRTDIMKQLLSIMPAAKRLLSVTNRKGNTVLHEAARTGIVEMAKLILKKEINGGDQVLISVRNLNGETPIYWAAMYGHRDMLLFLNATASSIEMIRSTSTSMADDPLITRTDGSTILHAAVLAGSYDVALEIMEIYPDLASSSNGDGAMASHMLALSPSSFKSGTVYSQQYLGASVFVLAIKVANIIYTCIPIESYGTQKTLQPDFSLKETIKHYFRWLCRVFRHLPVIKLIYNAKLKHSYAIELLRKLLEKDYGQWTMSYDHPPFEYQHSLAIRKRITNKVRERPIILATKLGIIEMVKEIIEAYPESIELTDEKAGRNLLHLAAEYRHESIIEFLKSSSSNSKRNLDMLVVGIDRDGNTPLHAAANLGKHKPWHIRGDAQWMQWECVWFQRIKRLLPQHMLTMKNCNNQNASQVFTETHRDLRQQGERWLKEGAGNCMLVSALIATVMFASAFTVPGGYDPQSGRPVLLKNQGFGPFLHYVALSLFFSLISLAFSLSIHGLPLTNTTSFPDCL
ncbi:hypothetical protein C5167_016315 [Papaver somniferum]|uniref:uncharacterized protein LOC113343854 n=1 Tax=Papaver somniferum TaxID=3469 RepID=UPI000E705B43|nr:uncharacterized protein LOC113343854 [Papaver somniferum]RZC93687.1 hypothetical protein C5167_016315 [Papaver somniferum]